MNVSHAAAIIGYEIFGRCARAQGFQARTLKPASVEVKEAMFAHIEEALTKAGFLDPENPLRMMRDVRRILNSAQLDDRDAKIVRGMFRKIGNMIRISRQRSRISPEDA
jgi:tRNA C32,U32 (ribose-2'-O)-methylase TrmJ